MKQVTGQEAQPFNIQESLVPELRSHARGAPGPMIGGA